MALWNSGIPDAAHDVLVELGDDAPMAFAMDDSGWWICVADDGTVHKSSATDFSAEVEQQLALGKTVEAISISPNGASWAIITDTDAQSFGLEGGAQDVVGNALGSGPAHCIAINNAGGVAVLTPTFFEARGIDDECYQTILNMRQHGRVDAVQFTGDGGWVVVDGDALVARNLDPRGFVEIGSFLSDGNAIATIAFTNGGSAWSLTSGTTTATTIASIPLRSAERNVADTTIWEGMDEAGALGVSVAIVEGSTITASAGYGRLALDGPAAVHPDSVFQAASISKLINALGVLRLVDDGAFSLNDDVRPFLNWDLGQRFLPEAKRVTFRQLLRHSAGVIGAGTTFLNPDLAQPAPLPAGQRGFGPPGQPRQLFTDDGGGFSGYTSASAVPSLLEILNGTEPANSPTIELSHSPNSRFSYSGAGTTLLQRAIEEVTGETYADWMQVEVLDPLGMIQSTFEIGPPDGFADDDQIAQGHIREEVDDELQPVEIIFGRLRKHPESAAAGLYTTALDLGRVISLVNGGGTIDGSPFLPTNLIDQMLKASPHPRSETIDAGLGCFTLELSDGAREWYHGGSNIGFRCKIFGIPDHDVGAVVMTNGSDSDFMNDVMNALRSAYGW